MPMVALALWENFFASPDWDMMPLGKYNRLPRPESSLRATVPSNWEFSSVAKVFMA
jgi:hypothetical protein